MQKIIEKGFFGADQELRLVSNDFLLTCTSETILTRLFVIDLIIDLRINHFKWARGFQIGRIFWEEQIITYQILFSLLRFVGSI